MNPASYSGFEIAAFVIMALVIVGLALVLYAKLHPATVVGKDVAAAEAKIDTVSDHVMQDARDFAADVTPTIFKAEIGVDNELSSLLGKVELKLLNTTGEDAAIASAKDYLARVTAEVQSKIDAANAGKAAKLAALMAHVATLTAATAPATLTPSATVNAGPAA